MIPLPLLSSLIFLCAWIIMTLHVLYKRKNPANLLVSLFFTIGIFINVLDRFYKDDPLYVFFLVAMAILAFIDFYYIPQVMRIERKIMRGERKIVRKGLRAFAGKKRGFF